MATPVDDEISKYSQTFWKINRIRESYSFGIEKVFWFGRIKSLDFDLKIKIRHEQQESLAGDKNDTILERDFLRR